MGRSASPLKVKSGSYSRVPYSPASLNSMSSIGCDQRRQATTRRRMSLRKYNDTTRSTSNDMLRLKICRHLSQAPNKAKRQLRTGRGKTRQGATLRVHVKRLHATMRAHYLNARENGLSAR